MAKPLSRKEQEAQKAEERIRKVAVERYRNRLGTLKAGMDFSAKENYKDAVQNYKVYLTVLANYFNAEEKTLSPKLFDQKKDLTEMLLVSQVYWDLAKIFDKNPNLFKDCERYLSQFVKFSTGYKYQYVNSEIIRKYIKSGKVRNIEAFKKAHEKLKSSKGFCFVATYAFGEDHPITNDLRLFRDHVLNQSPLGRWFIRTYYHYSPELVLFLCRHQKFGEIFTRHVAIPVLRIVNRITQIKR